MKSSLKTSGAKDVLRDRNPHMGFARTPDMHRFAYGHGRRAQAARRTAATTNRLV